MPDADLHTAALEYCQKIATRSRPGIAEMKRLAREGADLGIDQQMRLERDAAVRALPSDDVAEGLSAFENRRKPEFKAEEELWIYSERRTTSDYEYGGQWHRNTTMPMAGARPQA